MKEIGPGMRRDGHVLHLQAEAVCAHKGWEVDAAGKVEAALLGMKLLVQCPPTVTELHVHNGERVMVIQRSAIHAQ